MKVSIQRLPILSYRKEPDNLRLKTDVENARQCSLYSARLSRIALCTSDGIKMAGLSQVMGVAYFGIAFLVWCGIVYYMFRVVASESLG